VVQERIQQERDLSAVRKCEGNDENREKRGEGRRTREALPVVLSDDGSDGGGEVEVDTRERSRDDGSNLLSSDFVSRNLARPDAPSDVLPLPDRLPERRLKIRRVNLVLPPLLPLLFSLLPLLLLQLLQLEPILRRPRRRRQREATLEVLLLLATGVLRQDGFEAGLNDGSDFERSFFA
jgi:hypothetical protein